MAEQYPKLAHSNENHTLGGQGFKSGGGGGTYDEMEARVKAVEQAMVDIKVTLGRLDERTAALATKEDVSKVGTEVGKLQGEMKGTLGFWQFLMVVGALLAIVLRWPELFRMVGIPTP
ncbi:Uncharacterized protein MLTONO_0929 [Mesorhizobium loti]|uniref:hypothetical protein n=1 Tax=Mesorhizobium sp. 131-2-5 TaxID=2744519 RepID=UPI000819A4C0|nr:hypothetical protein [Mesorhizobium sp. 131-2-5]BAV45832.1 Uncharacterized protein MLTONO_0929 [Mesorhizobium loti]BCH01824.1 hypothetical protein MesoLj131b_38230 [Mesorhizobium sp. 131-2-5]